MDYETVRMVCALVGLLLFVVFFAGMVLWIYRPGARKRYEDDAKIPFKKDR